MMNEYILSWVLPKILAKKSPHVIPIWGKGAKNKNFFSIYLCNKNWEKQYRVEGFDKKNNTLDVLELNRKKGTYSIKKTLNLIEALSSQFLIIHYYSYHEFIYTNIYDLAFNFVTKYNQLKSKYYMFRNFLAQFLFNRKGLSIKNSKQLLKTILDFQLNSDISSSDIRKHSVPQGIGLFSLKKELWTIGWIAHPDSKKGEQKLIFYLNSLIDGGELKYNDMKYYVTGKGLKAYEQLERDERKHNDMVNLQKCMVFLTSIIALTEILKDN